MQASDARAIGAALIAAADKAEAAGQTDVSLNDVLSGAAHAQFDALQQLADGMRAQQAAAAAKPQP